jgi:hypothetical protein
MLNIHKIDSVVYVPIKLTTMTEQTKYKEDYGYWIDFDESHSANRFVYPAKQHIKIKLPKRYSIDTHNTKIQMCIHQIHIMSIYLSILLFIMIIIEIIMISYIHLCQDFVASTSLK